MTSGMNTIRKLLSVWMLARAGCLLLPMVSVAALSGTTYSHVPTTTTIPTIFAEHAKVAGADWSSHVGFQSMASNQSWASLSLSSSSVAPESGVSEGMSKPVGHSLKGPSLPPGQSAVDEVVAGDLGGVKFTAEPQYDPALTTYGEAVQGNRFVPAQTRVGQRATQSVGHMRETLLHEELHHRLWKRGVPSPHHPSKDAYLKSVLIRFFKKKGW